MSILVYPERQVLAEKMDDPSRTPAELGQALRHIDVLNSVFFGFAAVNKRIKQLLRTHESKSIRVLDVGCGSGKHLRQIRSLARQHSLEFSGVGVDISSSVISVANGTEDGHHPAIEYVVADALELPFGSHSFDLVVASLFFHHMDDRDIIAALKELNRVGKVVIINDLVRSKLAFWGLTLVTRLLPFCPMVKHDGPVSVKRSFVTDDFVRISSDSGIPMSVKRVPLFRILAETRLESRHAI